MAEMKSGERPKGVTRRTMVGYLIAGPTLVAGARLSFPAEAEAMVPTAQPVDAYDLSDLLRDSTRPTRNMVELEVKPDGTIHYNMPRSENGQGLTTAFAMIIADEMDARFESVKVTLADANPALQFNQFTGGSVSTYELYEPLRMASAAARDQMMTAAAERFGVAKSALTVADGVISAGTQSLTFAELSSIAAVSETRTTNVKLKRQADLRLIGTGRRRVDARLAVTGQKVFAMDLKIPGALPTALCRPPTINGNAEELLNRSEIAAMPGMRDIQVIPHTASADNGTIAGGVAVRCDTFGQCFDAIRAMKVRWSPGEVARAGHTLSLIHI